MEKSLLVFCGLLGLADASGSTGHPPAQFGSLECAVAKFALQYGQAKVPAASAQFIQDALNVNYLCANFSGSATHRELDGQLARIYDAESSRIEAERSATREAVMLNAAAATFYVATDGNDSNDGSLQSPFATLPRAATAARSTPRSAANPVVVYVRAGTYYTGDSPLVLSELDSNVTWAAYPADAGVGPVVLSGARLLSGLNWSPYTGGKVQGILQAPVTISDARRDAWFAARPGYKGAGPPPLVASLFVDGERQVRARFPNGNPQDNSGICFSATQRPGEGCPGWSGCSTGSTGNFPAPGPSASIQNIGPNRGSSPTYGCPQCTTYGSFTYDIFPPPADHPVYNQPLPGMGWSNNSLFSFWGSPFSRPSGVTVDARATCDGGHWASVNYSKPQDAVVHMFHSGLWGGWMYAVNDVTTSGPQEQTVTPSEFAAEATLAAPPAGMSLWLRADDLQQANGSPVTDWPDATNGKNNAIQPDQSMQPTYQTNCIGNLPCVSFGGSQWLTNTGFNLPPQSSIFAVILDKGTTTTYGSGVFYSKNGDNGVGTRSADAVASSDDDPAPVGSTITTLMLDWQGSPADPGHRDLSSRPSIISAVYTSASTLGFVDGCLELQDSAHGTPGQGFDIGTRNAEMGRYYNGVIGEILVYPTALSTTDRAAVNSYLSTKWGTPVPKHCAAPSSTSITVNFGYGGYQEARGSGINPGQHWYIENVLEELDMPGEWYYDADAGMLYVLPNGTDLTSAQVAVPLTDRVITVNGSQTGQGLYATNISFTGFTITQSRVTFLEQYEVPSGGDWSLHRGGAVFVQDAEGVSIVDCCFNQTGGNGVLFSNHVWYSSITDSEFHYTGDSGVLFIGSTTLMDGSAPTYPNGNTVARNHMHEWGVYGKQTSCFAMSLAANSTVVDNVCYNGPRAGFNFNDGFAGGHYVARNLVFNSVRETGDHGPLNSWDRQPYWTLSGMADGYPTTVKPPSCPQCSIVKAWDVNERNFMINGYNGVWTYDHDDGSQFVVDQYSFMVWGGCKNYLGNTKNCSNNVILYPGTDGRSAGNRRCQTDDNGVFANQYHEGNTCTSADGGFYSFSNCNANPPNFNSTVYRTAQNTLLSDTGSSFSQSCGRNLDFPTWQSFGQDVGSTTAVTPNVTALIALGAAVLGV